MQTDQTAAGEAGGLPAVAEPGRLERVRRWAARQDATAVRNALSVSIPIAVGTVAGEPGLGGLASIGALVAMYTHNRPYRQRARRWAYLSLLLLAAFVAGSFGAANQWAGVLIIGIVAGALTFGIKIVAIGPPAAYLLVLACATGTHLPPDLSELGQRCLVVALGSVCALLICSAGWLLSPDQPERLAVSMAINSVARLMSADPSQSAAARHAAYRAVHEAAVALSTASRRVPAGGLAAVLRELRRLVDGPLAKPAVDAIHIANRAVMTTGLATAASALRGGWPLRREMVTAYRPALGAVSELDALLGALTASKYATPNPLPFPGPFAVWKARVPRATRSAVRAALAATAAGCVAIALQVDRPYWGAAAAVAVLAGDGTRATLARAWGRFAGTVAGVVVAAGILATHPHPLVIVAIVAVLQVLIQLVVAHSYGLAVVAITPLALLLADAATGTVSNAEVLPRLVETAIGCLLALVARAAVFPNSAARHLPAVIEIVTERIAAWDKAATADPTLQRQRRLELERSLFALQDAVEAAKDELFAKSQTIRNIEIATATLEQTWPRVSLDKSSETG